MLTHSGVPPSLVDGFGDISKDLGVRAALVDGFGVIIAVNDQWKRFAKASHLNLPDYGVGQNYLRHCAFADPLSPRLIKGLSQLLGGEMGWLSLVYSCGTETRPASFLLFGFPHPDSPKHFVLMHVEISLLAAAITREQREVGAGAGSVNQVAAGGADSVDSTSIAAEHAILAALTEASETAQRADRAKEYSGAEENRKSLLSRRQLEVLKLVAEGLTNGEIAEKLGLSPNTIKVYISMILARLNLQSRRQLLPY